MPARACVECGFDFEMDLPALLAACEDAPATIGHLLAASGACLDQRPTRDVWAPIEYAAHVAEALRWYTERVDRVLAEAAPQLVPFDFDLAAEMGSYSRRSLDIVVAEVASAARALATSAAGLTAAELQRCGIGSDRSPRSVEALLVRAHHELIHHEWDLRRAAGPSSGFA